MKILQINASDTGVGGASKIALDLHSEYKKLGHDAHFLSGTGTKTEQSFHATPKQWTRKILARFFANDIEFFNSDFIFKQDYYKEADVIHFHNIHGWYFNLTTFQKICSEKKVVWTLHDQWALTPHCAHTTSNTITNGLYSCDSLKDYPSLLWNNDKHLSKKKRGLYEVSPFTAVTPSDWLRNRAQRILGNAHSIQTIANGIDTEIFTPTEKIQAREMLNLPKNKKIILFVAADGLNNEFKGGQVVREAIEVLKDKHDYRFIIIGSKDQELEKQYTSVQTHSAIYNPTKLAEYYSAADVLLCPSKFENAPLIILESLACDTPVIASKIGGIPELIKHKINGFLIEPTEVSDLVAGIEWILKHEKHQNLREDVVANYSIHAVAKKYISLYNKII